MRVPRATTKIGGPFAVAGNDCSDRTTWQSSAAESSTMTDRVLHLGDDSIPKLLFSFSLPAIVGMLAQAAYNLVDRVYIGRALGPDGIAGITVALPFMLILLACAMLVGFGAAALVSIRLGEQRKADAEQVLGNALLLLVLVSLLVTAVGLSLLDPMLRLFGASERVSAVRPRLPADHRPGVRVPTLRVWAERGDPGGRKSAHRDADAADRRDAQCAAGPFVHFRVRLGNAGGGTGDGAVASRFRGLGLQPFPQRSQPVEAEGRQSAPLLGSLLCHPRHRHTAFSHATDVERHEQPDEQSASHPRR